MATMQAVRIHSYGEAPRVERVPRPEPRGSQVLVHVKAAGVNPLDWWVADGQAKDWLPHNLPLTLGWEVAGVVEDVGADMARFKAGDEVYGMGDYSGEGADAEYAAIDESALAIKPRALDFAQAAAVPVGALTAWMALFDAGKLSAGQTVLVHGAAGAVGSMAVQLAKAKRARVIGTASADHLDLLRDLGCDRAIDYRAAPFEQQLQGEPIDVVIDSVGGDTQKRSFSLLKKGGVLVALTDEPDQAEAKRHGVRAEMISVRPDGARLEEIARMIDAGQIVPHVQTVLPLDQAARAFEMSKTRHVGGKIVLTP